MKMINRKTLPTLLILALFVGNSFAETYSCPFTIDEGRAELHKIERIKEKNTFKDVMYPEEKPWDIYFEDENSLALVTSFPNYELWTFVLNKKTLTFQWATIGNDEMLPYPVIEGKCYTDSN